MFIDAKDIEENIWAYGRLLNRVLDEYLEQEKVYGQQKSYLDTEESKEGYGQWKSDPVFHFFQHTNESLSDFYSSLDPEANKSFFSILEAKYIDDYHKDEFTCTSEPFLSYE